MRYLILTLSGFFVITGCFQVNSNEGTTTSNAFIESKSTDSRGLIDKGLDPVDHSALDVILKKYVSERGLVNYKGITADSAALNNYLDMLSANEPDQKTWSESAQLAYWINAYNAFTIQLIIRNYPVKSIKDIAGKIPFINTSWNIKFIHIGDNEYHLDNIEHGIIRKQFDDERIHFALVCAAVSCPPLREEAYTAEKLNDQLNDQAIIFFNDITKNEISENEAILSPILKWYSSDFKDKAEDLGTYINKYSNVKINPGVEITYANYDWALNDYK